LGLEDYDKKRDFRRTPEPKGRRKKRARAAALQFVVQQHAARAMHWDFRLELDGVLKSWAVPKGPSLVAGERRMAAQTEDHPLEYATFEGVIPKGEYGGGTVVVWDRGYWQPIGDAHSGLAKGKLDFTLAGEKLRGRWHLVRMRGRASDRGRASWLLIKGRDAEARPATSGAVVATEPKSVISGRKLDEVAQDADRVWSSRTGEHDAPAIGAPGDPSQIEGSRKAAFPAGAEPQLATLVDEVPEGEGWLHEIKLDGYRLLCAVRGAKVEIRSRNGHDWTRRFPGLAEALRALPAKAALLDGEAVVFDAHGRTSFSALQEALGRGEAGAADVAFTAFDCLYLDGRDLRGAALEDRKRALRALLARAPGETAIRFGDHVAGRGDEFFEAACASGLEGTVAKRADAPYRAGRTRSWLKVKCTRRQELVIVGFTEPGGSRVGLGALLLGAHDATGTLRYCGKVGTGFDRAALDALRKKLGRLEREKPPVADPPRMRGVHWVTPKLVAEVAFTEWTRDGKIRHPVYLGLREDKEPAEVKIEKAAPPAAAPSAPKAAPRDAIAGVRLSSPDRVYFPDLGVTKRELAEYWEAVAERALPGMARRPLSLLRCPEGIEGHCFYQKHARPSVPETVARVLVRDDPEPYAMVTDLASIVSLVQVGALELHVQGARADRLDRPDLAVFDLDPDPAVPFERVKETAKALRTLLAEVGLASFVRATGGKGVHVVSPLVRKAGWDEVRGFTKGIALELVRLAPTQFTAKMSKAGRKGKIFIDWVRNTPEATAIASYSPRARPGAPVAVPIAWDELAELRGPLLESVREVPRRLADADPWAEFESSRRPLTREAVERFGAKD
jgi:bifunctional non-homologous end joining protein LigD